MRRIGLGMLRAKTKVVAPDADGVSSSGKDHRTPFL